MELLSKEWGVGIDPGWVNAGYATVKAAAEPFKFEIKTAGTANPSSVLSPESIIHFIFEETIHPMSARDGFGRVLIPLSIERYVSYGNVRSTHGEEILEIIGMLRMEYWRDCGFAPVNMIRALDWKTKLCQTLVRHTGFNNPSKKGLLDKEFSVAVAKHLTTNHGSILKTDHEADAIALAAYPLVLAQAKEIEAEKRRILGEQVG